MAGTFTIRPARPDDAPALTDLALRSKAHWGYDAAFMALCRAELTMTPARIASEVAVIVQDLRGASVGFASFATGDGRSAEILNCFVDPPAIGRGVGRALLAALLGEARRAGIATVMVDSDPHAEGFYLREGFQRIGTAPSGSIPGRRLPRLRLLL